MIKVNGVFDLIQHFSVNGFGILAVGRGIILYARGIKVLIINWHRPSAEKASDSAFILGAVIWYVEVIAHSKYWLASFMPAWMEAPLYESVAISAVGAVMLVAAVLGYAIALIGFGESWRIGIDHRSPGKLVTEGIYALSRNPIYFCLNLLLFGSFVLQGRPILLLLALILAALIHGVILREEHFLEGLYGQDYRDYCARVGRYLSLPCRRGAS